jgi:hypothetical protein
VEKARVFASSKLSGMWDRWQIPTSISHRVLDHVVAHF